MESLKGPEIIRLKPEKDDSDTQSAVNQMIRKGAKDILILELPAQGWIMCWRIWDWLSMGKEQGVRIAIADQWNYITLAESGTILHREEQFGKYVSFFTVGGDVTGLTLKGFKYPLNGYHLTV